jgi:putative oxidoreductase
MGEARVYPTDAVALPVAQNARSSQRGRAALIALWATQVALAAMFLMAGRSKLIGEPSMVSLFDAIGVGQWFRYATGVIELTAGVTLLRPSAAVYGALLLIPTMIGAIATNLFVTHVSPLAPFVLLLAVAAVAWARRRDLYQSLVKFVGWPRGDDR